MLVKLASGPLVTIYGEWVIHLYWSGTHQVVALVHGLVRNKRAIPTRIHSACLTAHVFGSVECDCREQMSLAMSAIERHGSGLVILLDQEGRGNGMMAHVASQALKRQGVRQSAAYQRLGYSADSRRYDVAAEVIRLHRIRSVLLLTNNPHKQLALEAAGVAVAGTTRVQIRPDNLLLARQYEDKLADGHMLLVDSGELPEAV